MQRQLTRVISGPPDSCVLLLMMLIGGLSNRATKSIQVSTTKKVSSGIQDTVSDSSLESGDSDEELKVDAQGQQVDHLGSIKSQLNLSVSRTKATPINVQMKQDPDAVDQPKKVEQKQQRKTKYTKKKKQRKVADSDSSYMQDCSNQTAKPRKRDLKAENKMVTKRQKDSSSLASDYSHVGDLVAESNRSYDKSFIKRKVISLLKDNTKLNSSGTERLISDIRKVTKGFQLFDKEKIIAKFGSNVKNRLRTAFDNVDIAVELIRQLYDEYHLSSEAYNILQQKFLEAPDMPTQQIVGALWSEPFYEIATEYKLIQYINYLKRHPNSLKKVVADNKITEGFLQQDQIAIDTAAKSTAETAVKQALFNFENQSDDIKEAFFNCCLQLYNSDTQIRTSLDLAIVQQIEGLILSQIEKEPQQIVENLAQYQAHSIVNAITSLYEKQSNYLKKYCLIFLQVIEKPLLFSYIDTNRHFITMLRTTVNFVYKNPKLLTKVLLDLVLRAKDIQIIKDICQVSNFKDVLSDFFKSFKLTDLVQDLITQQNYYHVLHWDLIQHFYGCQCQKLLIQIAIQTKLTPDVDVSKFFYIENLVLGLGSKTEQLYKIDYSSLNFEKVCLFCKQLSELHQSIQLEILTHPISAWEVQFSKFIQSQAFATSLQIVKDITPFLQQWRIQYGAKQDLLSKMKDVSRSIEAKSTCYTHNEYQTGAASLIAELDPDTSWLVATIGTGVGKTSIMALLALYYVGLSKTVHLVTTKELEHQLRFSMQQLVSHNSKIIVYNYMSFMRTQKAQNSSIVIIDEFDYILRYYTAMISQDYKGCTAIFGLWWLKSWTLIGLTASFAIDLQSSLDEIGAYYKFIQLETPQKLVKSTNNIQYRLEKHLNPIQWLGQYFQNNYQLPKRQPYIVFCQSSDNQIIKKQYSYHFKEIFEGVDQGTLDKIRSRQDGLLLLEPCHYRGYDTRFAKDAFVIVLTEIESIYMLQQMIGRGSRSQGTSNGIVVSRNYDSLDYFELKLKENDSIAGHELAELIKMYQAGWTKVILQKLEQKFHKEPLPFKNLTDLHSFLGDEMFMTLKKSVEERPKRQSDQKMKSEKKN